MLASEFEIGKPVWALYGPRAWGPFDVCVRGLNHLIVRVPNDRRLWVDTERLKASKKSTLEMFPFSCLTQDPAEASAWNELNEPRVGDLISIKHRKRIWNGTLRMSVISDETFEGVVYNETGHQVQIMRGAAADDPTRSHHYTKDSCTIISKGGSNED